MRNIAVISDTHGFYFTLLKLIKALPKTDLVVLVGDFNDRGFYSDKIIKLLKQQADINSEIFDPELPMILSVLGNHEVMLIDAYYEIILGKNDSVTFNKDNYPMFFDNGVENTLFNYLKKEVKDKLIEDNKPLTKFEKTDLIVSKLKNDIEFLESLPLYHEFKNNKDESGRHLVVSHSSISKVWDETKDTQTVDKLFQKSILWNREKNPVDIKNIFNVFGHTINKWPVVDKHFANVDTGAYELNRLTAIRFPSKDIISVDIDKKDLSRN